MKKYKGQVIVEFALILPLFFFIIYSIIYSGMLFHDYSTLSNIARASAREAALSDESQYDTIAGNYESQLDTLMTNFYTKIGPKPIVIVPEGDDGVKTTINMRLNVSGYFVDMILPQTFDVQYYMRKEPVNPISSD